MGASDLSRVSGKGERREGCLHAPHACLPFGIGIQGEEAQEGRRGVRQRGVSAETTWPCTLSLGGDSDAGRGA